MIFPASVARADEGPHVASLISTAQRLLVEARKIRAANPHTIIGAAKLVDGGRGIAGRFYAEERAFQDSVVAGGSVAKYRNKNAAAAQLDLATFDSFVYSAVLSIAATCNSGDADANLRVAQSQLDEARRDLAGTARDDWEPPEIDPNGKNLCLRGNPQKEAFGSK